VRTFVLCGSFLLASIAGADAIGPAPACPPGARARYSHSGEWCVPWPCDDDSQCESNHCRSWRVCSRFASVPPGGLRPINDTTPASREELVLATCAPDANCRGDEEPPPPIVGTFETAPTSCRTARFCVPDRLPAFPWRQATTPSQEPASNPATAPVPSTHGGACGCTAQGSASTAAVSLGMLGLVLAWRRRK
jgi:MYXO-CTERM domain-containing protein